MNTTLTYLNREQNLDPKLHVGLFLGGFVPSAGHAGKYFLKALKVKSKLISEINNAFEEI